MLAAFVAAGYSLTAEAGVVKVVSPVNGQEYIIADNTNGALLDKTYSASQPVIFKGGSSVTGENASSTTVPSATDGYVWTVEQGAHGIILKSGEKYLRNNTTLTLDVQAVATEFVYNAENAENKLSALDEDGDIIATDPQLTISNGAASLSASGTDVDFYAITKPYFKGTTEAQVIKIHGKYLVYNTSLSTPAVQLVDEDTYNAIKTLNPDNTTWTVNDKGVLVCSGVSGNNELKISTDNDAVKLELASTGSGNALEYNEDLGLFGYTDAAVSTTGQFVQWVDENKIVVIDNDNVTYADDVEGTNEIDAADAVVSEASDYSTPIDLTIFDDYEVADGLDEADVFIGFENSSAAAFVSKAAEANAPTSVTDPTTNADATSWTLSYNSSTGLYTIKNAAGATFTVDGVNQFYLEGNVKGFKLYSVTGTGAAATKNYVQYSSNAFSLTTTSTNATVFALFTGLTQYFTIGELNEGQGNNFMLDMVSSINGKDLQGNVFDGRTLVAVKPKYQGTEIVGFEAYDDNSLQNTYMLQDAATGEIIVVDMTDTWSVGGINQHIKDAVISSQQWKLPT